ncbi:uncharacterized protein [Magallana gigas]|uniref:uncharacterized protein isoform X3 n=1 Tax=Magallana gigas TaxID=29159 RepID=UPI0033415638
MITRFDPLLLLLCHVILGGQLVCGDSCPKDKECCPKCADTEPSQTTATCSCSTPTSLQTTANSSRTTTGESPHSTTAIPSPSPNSSSLASSCPTVVTTAPSPGSIIGATLGGAAFGSILTVIVFVCSRRRSHSADDSKEELTPNVVRNAAYQYNNGHINLASSTSVNSAYSEIHHNATRKAARISPVMRQEDTIWKEEVYNHLHESDKEDRSDYYDHAGPVPSLSVIEDGYGVLSMESKGNDNYNTVDRDYSTDCGKSMTAEHCK